MSAASNHSCLGAVAVAGLQRQRCKVCWHADGLDFDMPDDVWAAVLPERLRNRVVCLACFDRMASEVGVDYAPHLRRVCFAGLSTGFEFEVKPCSA